MVEIVGDPCIPSELIIPTVEGTTTDQPQMSGALIMSGGKLLFLSNVGYEIITSTSIG